MINKSLITNGIALCLLLLVRCSTAHEYLYPVASFIDEYGVTQLLLIHQKSLQEIEVLQWDAQSRHALPLLPARYVPGGVRVIPGNKGFSFLDDGRLRIKEFAKRSPRSFDFNNPYPLTQIGIVSWLDAGTGYCAAKTQGHYGIFQLTADGVIAALASEEKADCLYPVIIDDLLFYIVRAQDSHGALQTSIHSLDTSKSTTKEQASQVCLTLGSKAIAFLSMINKTEGFFLEHPVRYESNQKSIHGKYHYFFNHGNAWHSMHLFSFSIPLKYIQGNAPERIYESFLPLLPCVVNDTIYFVSETRGGSLGMFIYDRLKDTVKSRSNIPFPVIGMAACGNKLYYGGCVSNDFDVNNVTIAYDPLDPLITKVEMPSIVIP